MSVAEDEVAPTPVDARHVAGGGSATVISGRARTIIFWAHLATGACVGIMVLVMAVTGALLAYQPQLQAWSDTRGLDGAPPHADVPALGIDALLERVARTRDGNPTAIRLSRAADAPVEVQYGRDARVFVNAYTGAVLGAGSDRARNGFAKILGVHRWLGFDGDARGRARAITGAANLGFLLLICSGFILWWPRNLSRRAFRAVLLFRGGLRSKARDFNWHNVIGIWSCVPLAIIVASAVVISYGWAGSVIERVAGDAAVPAAVPAAVAGPLPAGGPDAAIARARQLEPRWRAITLQLPARGERYTLIVAAGGTGQPHKQARLRVAETTGAVVEWEPFSAGPAAQRLRSLLRYAHTGEVLGVIGQTVAGLVSAGAAVLVWTGLSLALRRLAAWRRRRARA